MFAVSYERAFIPLSENSQQNIFTLFVQLAVDESGVSRHVQTMSNITDINPTADVSQNHAEKMALRKNRESRDSMLPINTVAGCVKAASSMFADKAVHSVNILATFGEVTVKRDGTVWMGGAL